MNKDKSNPAGWLRHDDSCGFGCRWVPFWEKTLQKRGFAIAPLQAGWVREKLQLNENDRSRDIRLPPANGKQVQGADHHRYAMKRI